MIIVIRNREVVHAYALNGSIFFLLELFFFKDVISGCLLYTRRILILSFHICIHVSDLFVHVRHFVFVSDLGCRLLLLSWGIDVIYNLHLVVYVDDLIGFSFFWRPGLKPAIFQLYFLNGACCRFNLRYTLHAGNSFRDQELLLRREIVVKFPFITTLPSTCQN